jgi:hypothetical protein
MTTLLLEVPFQVDVAAHELAGGIFSNGEGLCAQDFNEDLSLKVSVIRYKVTASLMEAHNQEGA